MAENSPLPSACELEEAVKVLQRGGIVAYPTETYYGLAVDPANPQAVKSLYALKKRSNKKALSLLVSDVAMLRKYVDEFPDSYKRLIDAFWPGPLTLIFKARDGCLQGLQKKDQTLAIRISSHPIAQKITDSYNKAITASSANISGQLPVNSADSVKALWGDKIDLIMDGGKTVGNRASTIVQCDATVCTILRDGVIPMEDLQKVLPKAYIICKS